nr:MAG TPA: hypothetical protein [Caudoviricetes sp.]
MPPILFLFLLYSICSRMSSVFLIFSIFCKNWGSMLKSF